MSVAESGNSKTFVSLMPVLQYMMRHCWSTFCNGDYYILLCVGASEKREMPGYLWTHNRVWSTVKVSSSQSLP
jgi:hypothetical protein